jgi:hypothetical protein
MCNDEDNVYTTDSLKVLQLLAWALASFDLTSLVTMWIISSFHQQTDRPDIDGGVSDDWAVPADPRQCGCPGAVPFLDGQCILAEGIVWLWGVY